MLNLLREKINNTNDLDNLKKLSNILQFAIKQKMRSISPPPEEMTLILDNVQDISNEDYSQLSTNENIKIQKEGYIKSIDELNSFMKERHLGESVNEMLHGKKATEQQKIIDFTLLMVEQNNLEYFESRPSIYDNEPHDLLAYHYIIITERGISNFNFLKESDLPEYIRDEVITALKDATKDIQ